ncbi:MAG: MBOAT family O-acyltransferase [Ruminococcus sp.]
MPLFGKRRKIGGLLLVWFCTGLWHGASWNYIIWGIYYGLFLMLEMGIGKGHEEDPGSHPPYLQQNRYRCGIRHFLLHRRHRPAGRYAPGDGWTERHRLV